MFRLVLWAVTPIVVLADANVSEEFPASVFMVKVCMLRISSVARKVFTKTQER
jgi:hypothetical protein